MNRRLLRIGTILSVIWNGLVVSSFADTPHKITLAVSESISIGLVYIAVQQGLFVKEDLEVTLQTYTSGKLALKSVLEDKADIATVAELPFILAVLSGQKLYLLSMIHESSLDLSVLARKDLGVNVGSDLLGKRIGVTKGTTSVFFLNMLLIQQRILMKDVILIETSPEQMLDALNQGKVDAVSTWLPYSLHTQMALGERGVIFDGRSIYNATFNLAAKQNFVAEHPKIVEKLLRAFFHALNWSQENFATAEQIVLKQIKLDESEQEQFKQKKLWRPAFGFNQNLIFTLENQARWAIQNKLIEYNSEPNLLQFLYFPGLEAVAPESITLLR